MVAALGGNLQLDQLLGGKQLTIPIFLSHHGIAVRVTALLDTGADVYMLIKKAMSEAVLCRLGATERRSKLKQSRRI